MLPKFITWFLVHLIQRVMWGIVITPSVRLVTFWSSSLKLLGWLGHLKLNLQEWCLWSTHFILIRKKTQVTIHNGTNTGQKREIECSKISCLLLKNLKNSKLVNRFHEAIHKFKNQPTLTFTTWHNSTTVNWHLLTGGRSI